ncbi:MAG: hypothetical protein AAB451_00665 [Patescibacteria group bacterium]
MAEEKKWKDIPHRYMMATKAIHLLGDISSKTPNLCSIHGEDDENYIGNWVEGFGFINVKFPKATTRELTQEEKDKWDGVVIGINDSPRFRIHVKDANPKPGEESKNWVLPEIIKDFLKPERIVEGLRGDLQNIIERLEKEKESPVLVLPEDKKRQNQLKIKLAEYKKRLDPYCPPWVEMQMDTICKKTVLEQLLKNGQIKTWDISLEMAKTYGSGFNVDLFNNACGVIEGYCKTGGANLRGGTGLAKVH